MRCKVTVVGELPSLDFHGHAEVVGPDALPGSHLVVIGGGADLIETVRRVALRASGAVVFVVEGELQTAVSASLLPRGRVIGVDAGELAAAAEAVVFDTRSEATVRLLDLEGQEHAARVILGARGVREYV